MIVVCPNCGAKNRVPDDASDDMQPVCGRCKTRLSANGNVNAAFVHPLTVTDETFARDVLQAGNKPVLLDCWAPWCGPCRMLAPALEQLAAESQGRYLVAKLNTDENPAVAAQFRIEALPTMLVFKNGRVVDKLVGLVPKQAIAQKLSSYV
jgi:thioredoxin 2